MRLTKNERIQKSPLTGVSLVSYRVKRKSFNEISESMVMFCLEEPVGCDFGPAGSIRKVVSG